MSEATTHLRQVVGYVQPELKDELSIWLLDFRRTLASYVYMHVKADEMLVKAILNHYDSRPCAVYTRLNFDFLAPIMQGYADWVWSFKQEVPDEPSHYQPESVPRPTVPAVRVV